MRARSIPILALLTLAPGCYLWHGAAEEGGGLAPADASVPRDAITTPADVGPHPPDAAPFTRSCAPMDADDGHCACSTFVCDDLPPGAIRAWSWDGTGCVPHRDCSCTGADCGARFPTRDACAAAYAACDSQLCHDTGGRWDASACGHFACGLPSGDDCIDPGCDCGPGRSFAEGSGCFDDPRCSDEELCAASDGRFVPDARCGFRCGEESCTRDLPPRVPCDCGPGRTFLVGTRGCAPDLGCTVSPESLCASTGGSWSGICCHTECGRFCPVPCAAPACDCGPGMRFDESRGCYADPMCPAPEGERCEPWREAPCIDPGATCCAGDDGSAPVCRTLDCRVVSDSR